LGKPRGDRLECLEDKYFERVVRREGQSVGIPKFWSRYGPLITGGHAITDLEVQHSERNLEEFC
jgi:hypothetical protein